MHALNQAKKHGGKESDKSDDENCHEIVDK